ncbi:MAG: hypothetical protein WEB60_10225 [Terrimicrobiaceae bacterium]
MTKDDLLAEIARSRLAIARDFGAVKEELNVSKKLGRTFSHHPLVWLGGAAALGWIIAGPKTKTRVVTVGKTSKGATKKTVTKPAGFLAIFLTILRIAVPMLKPVFSAYAAKRFAEMASKLAG